MDEIIAKVPSKVVGVAKDGHVIYGAVKSGSISNQNAELYTAWTGPSSGLAIL